jgi:hypothetical protein
MSRLSRLRAHWFRRLETGWCWVWYGHDPTYTSCSLPPHCTICGTTLADHRGGGA